MNSTDVSATLWKKKVIDDRTITSEQRLSPTTVSWRQNDETTVCVCVCVQR